MFKLNLKTAIRSLVKDKAYTTINIVGLSISLTASILLFLWITDEQGFDGFHKNANRLYSIFFQLKSTEKQQIFSSTPGPLAEYGVKDLPEIESYCRINRNNDVSLFKYKEKSFLEDKCLYADPSFFSMFSFPLVKGNSANPFPDSKSIVISETIAKKYFNDEDPIGKVVKADDKQSYTITGVIKDIPANSSIQGDLIFPRDLSNDDVNTNWGNYSYRTYLLLKPNANQTAVEQKLLKTLVQNSDNDFSKHLRLMVQPMLKVHLYKPTGEESGMQIVRIFFVVACIILLIACINYVNLVTARATKRAKEISMRKIIGAEKWQLFIQFIGESAMLFTIAMILSIIIIQLVVPFYNDLSGKKIVFNLFHPRVLWVFGSTFLATLALAGIYPALLLSSFKPLEAFKGSLGSIGKGLIFRKVLVVVQFTFSVILISSTIVIGNQLKYVREKNLGYDKENIITIQMRQEMIDHYAAVKDQLSKTPGISGVSAATQSILNIGSGTGDADWDGKKPEQSAFHIFQFSLDRDLFKLLNMQMVEGSGFTGTAADSINYIFNETAIARMGIKDPIGKRFTFHSKRGIIAGIVKDFNFSDMHQTIEPCILYFNPGHWRTLYVKTTGKDAATTVNTLEKTWKQYSGDFPFSYSFMDDKFNDMYKGDLRIGKLFNCFAFIAILISSLGLLGLITYTAETKVKEIGIRKTLGASVGSIVGMLSKDFVRLMLIASAIAIPLAWLAMKSWLQNYAYRTEIQWWFFAIAAGGALVIAIITVGFQSIKAALANPVTSLRSE